MKTTSDEERSSLDETSVRIADRNVADARQTNVDV